MPTKITDLEAKTSLATLDLIPIIDTNDLIMSPAGSNKKIEAGNFANGLAKLFTSNAIISANTNDSALSIAQTGNGNALSVQNVNSPDNTPFVVDKDGKVGIGTVTPLTTLHVVGNVTLPSTTTIGNVTATEIGYLDGITGNIQTRLDNKANKISPIFSGTVTLPTGNSTAAPLKFVSGENLITAQAGAVEFDGSNLYITNSTADRKTLAFTDIIIGVNETRVGNFSISATDTGKIFHSTSLTTASITLPPIENVPDGWSIGIVNVGGASLTVSGNATINGVSTIVNTIKYSAFYVYKYGNEWLSIGLLF